MGENPRGTVTPLSESISVQDAENVAKKVAEAIDSQMQQLRTLQGFADENQSLTKQLLELPDLVSYNIMVPLGKAAFMPGRLIHTNEFLVLLGEGYYAERSAKQAAEILTRRSNFIRTKIGALEEQIRDLEAEASFVKETAAEAADGLVEIREEYTETSSQPAVKTAKTSNKLAITATVQDDKEIDGDDEDARLLARLAELQMAEEAAEDEEEEEEEEEDEAQDDFRAIFRRSHLDDLNEEEEDDDDDGDDSEDDDDDEDEDSEEFDFDDRTMANTILNRSAVRFTEAEGQDQRHGFQSSVVHSQVQSSGQGSLAVSLPAAGSSEGRRQVKFSEVEDAAKASPPEPLRSTDIKASAAQKRAFTGSVMERNTDLLPPVPPVAPEAPSKRPVSKFKQRNG